MLSPPKDARNETVPWGGTGMLYGLTGSHTRVVIYLTLAIHYQRVVIHASLNTRFKGEVGSELPSCHQTTKVTLTEDSPERSGYMHMDKQVTHSILDMVFSMRGTKTAKVEGLWLINRLKCCEPEYPDDSPKVWWCSPFIVPSLYSMRDPCDIMKWCHTHLLLSSSWKTTAHVHQNCQHLSAHLPAPSLELQLLWMHPNLFVSPLTWSLHLVNFLSMCNV